MCYNIVIGRKVLLIGPQQSNLLGLTTFLILFLKLCPRSFYLAFREWFVLEVEYISR